MEDVNLKRTLDLRDTPNDLLRIKTLSTKTELLEALDSQLSSQSARRKSQSAGRKKQLIIICTIEIIVSNIGIQICTYL